MARKDRLSDILFFLLKNEKITQLEARAIRLALFEFANDKTAKTGVLWVDAVKELLQVRK